jgi:predicted membrane-bound mannosyltransferase
MILALAAAFFASLVLFTSFFQNPKGLLDSLLSFRIYFVRAGEGGFHIHPWFYYFQILAFSKGAARLLWSEAFILVLAVAGSVAAFKVRRSEQPHPSFLKFIFFYTVAATAVYSIIPYKTPWNLLPFYAGFILLAGSGAAFIFKACPKKYVRALILLFLAVGFLNLAVESYRANFLFPADPRSPYVYAQTSPDFLKLIRRVEDLASFDPDGKKMLIKVIASPYETWPLPWYLRSFDRVGYWKSTEEAGEIDTPPLIISSTEEAAKLESSLKDIYRSEYYGLRPGVLLTLHVRNDLWEKFLKKSHL